jgi:Family of unknown function (DUF6427)
MLLRLFKGTGPGVIFLIAVTLALLWISAFLDPQMPVRSAYETNPMPLYSIISYLLSAHPLAGIIFSFLILLVIIILLTYFNTSVFFINERTFLPAVFYILFSALFPEYQVLNPVLPAALFLMLAIMRIMETYRKPGTAFSFFDAGILISLGSMFYVNLIWFGLLLIIGIALLRTGNIKEPAISILGLLTPYLLIAGLYYVLGKDLGAFLTTITNNLFGESPKYEFSRLTIIVLILAGQVFLFSLIHLMMGMNSKKIKSRKTFSLLLWALIISLILYFSLPSVSVEIIWITGIPASYILAHYFVFVKRKILPEIMFSGFLILVLLVQILYIF